MPREIPLAASPARMARRAFAIADGRARTRLASERIRRHVRASASFAADGLLGNVGMKADDEPHYLGARGIRFHLWSESALLKKAGCWIIAGELVKTRAVCMRGPDHRQNRAGMDRNGRRASAEKVDVGCTLGEESGAGRCLRARDALRPDCVCAPSRKLRQTGPEIRARSVHSRRAGRRRIRHAPAVLRTQPQAGRGHRTTGAQARRQDVLVDDELIFGFYV